ncbi:unnamed protein product, partial [marine sediment metagenome]
VYTVKITGSFVAADGFFPDIRGSVKDCGRG